MRTATLTRSPHRDRAATASILATLRHPQFKNTYRRACALEAGANPAQLAALALLEHRYDNHYPEYATGPDGSITATYTRPDTAPVTACVRADGTTRIRQ
ncbi:hypothetical protein ABH924_004357 [Arthrobacter sp. GAS37]|uniref:hypothetical protein n=1 Tax=Arthrobacter sp. GAS37 TaxID=3156261 RepID=UPI00383268C6